tara:strand:- start:6970 stop:7215 length:246 start_codon:yes stop_codon:yes gene_type:complete
MQIIKLIEKINSIDLGFLAEKGNICITFENENLIYFEYFGIKQVTEIRDNIIERIDYKLDEGQYRDIESKLKELREILTKK